MFVWLFVWFFRNKIIFNDEVISFQKASFIISSYVCSWSKSFISEEVGSKPMTTGKLMAKGPWVGPTACWSPPLEGFL